METDIFDIALTPSAQSLPASTTVTQPIRTLLCLIASDSLAITIAMLAASALRDILMHSRSASVFEPLVAALILVLCSLTSAGLYPGVAINPVEELRRSTRAVTLALFGLWSATLFLHDLTQSRLVYAIAYVFTVGLIPMLRSMVRRMFAAKPWWGSPVAILGFGMTGKFVYETLIGNPGIGLKPVAILDDNPAQYAKVPQHLHRGPLARCLEIMQGQSIPYAIVCMPGLSRHELLHLVEFYGQCFGHLIVIPNLIGMTSLGITAREVGGVIGLEVRRQLLRPSARLTKRSLDLLFALLTAPVTALVVLISAILIKLEDGGPAFYANERIGLGGEKFKAWKLRSMVLNGDRALEEYLQSNPEEAESWHRHQKLAFDPRITRVGRLLRKTSIDELPQFWNVLVGEMSVVGPRPILERQIPLYGNSFPLYKQVRPGITGLWQVSGRNKLTFSERAKLDRYVIQNWSVWLDIYILARTPSAVFTSHGAC